MEPLLLDPERGGNHNFKNTVAEVATVEFYFVFYVIIKIIIMPTHTF